MSCLRFEFYHKGMLRNEVSLCLLMVYADSCGRLDFFAKLEYFLRFSFAVLNHFYIFAINFTIKNIWRYCRFQNRTFIKAYINTFFTYG